MVEWWGGSASASRCGRVGVLFHQASVLNREKSGFPFTDSSNLDLIYIRE